ncbi:hypothetical protein DMA11_24375 [Marinilabiliaceae bacterium JC017]|nr:hypothetical protein DMA11_24375 [Marinilabiliaceae bacterium JC017]
MQILSNTLYANRTLLYLFEYLIKIEIFLVSSICSIKLPLFFVCPLLRICNVINLKKKKILINLEKAKLRIGIFDQPGSRIIIISTQEREISLSCVED